MSLVEPPNSLCMWQKFFSDVCYFGCKALGWIKMKQLF